jgi:coenzyme PQQ synthesis protein D (PqqD)
MARVTQNPEVVVTELEDGAVLLNMQTRLYYSLNDAGLAVWNLVDGSGSPGDLVTKLGETFALDDPAGAEEAISKFLAELEREALVVAGERDAPAHSGAEAPTTPSPADKRRFAAPELIKHDEPLHEVSTSPFDPQLPLAE